METPTIEEQIKKQNKIKKFLLTKYGKAFVSAAITVTLVVNAAPTLDTKYGTNSKQTTASAQSQSTIRAFSDVNQGMLGYEEIYKLANAKVISGYPDGTFKPYGSITRAEFATIIARAFNLSPMMGGNMFNDISDSWAKDYINAVAQKGYIAGVGNGNFEPESNITVQDAVVINNNIIKKENINIIKADQQSLLINPLVAAYAIDAINNADENDLIDSSFNPIAYATRGQVAFMVAKIVELDNNKELAMPIVQDVQPIPVPIPVPVPTPGNVVYGRWHQDPNFPQSGTTVVLPCDNITRRISQAYAIDISDDFSHYTIKYIYEVRDIISQDVSYINNEGKEVFAIADKIDNLDKEKMLSLKASKQAIPFIS